MTKKYLIICLFILLFITGCTTGLKSNSYGLENNGYIRIIGSKADYPDYSDIYMIIDNEKKVDVSVTKDIKKKPSGKIYRISPGTHEIKIFKDNELLLKQDIFVSSQEIKKVYLP